jgi:hypothetical protein
MIGVKGKSQPVSGYELVDVAETLPTTMHSCNRSTTLGPHTAIRTGKMRQANLVFCRPYIQRMVQPRYSCNARCISWKRRPPLLGMMGT